MKLKIERVEVFGFAMTLVDEYKNAYLSNSIVKSAMVCVTALGGADGYRLETRAAA